MEHHDVGRRGHRGEPRLLRRRQSLKGFHGLVHAKARKQRLYRQPSLGQAWYVGSNRPLGNISAAFVGLDREASRATLAMATATRGPRAGGEPEPAGARAEGSDPEFCEKFRV